jgi:Fe-S oxidoreductase
VKIDTADVTLHLRSFLEDKGAGGHPFKHRVFDLLARDVSSRLPKAAKALSLGQRLSNNVVRRMPASWRERARNPVFQGPGPELGFRNLTETLHTSSGPLFSPAGNPDGKRAVLYFPGCGAGLFYRDIGLAGLYLLLRSGTSVALPEEHLCCGYPLLAQGCQEAYQNNREANMDRLSPVMERAKDAGLKLDTVLTSCGTCREGLKSYGLESGARGIKLTHLDVSQYLLEAMPRKLSGSPERLLYHAACHAEWSGVPAAKAGQAYASALAEITGARVDISPHCCGESGLGALTSPDIYNRIRSRKQAQLGEDLRGYPRELPILVGCPSCKIGLSRSMIAMGRKRPVLHSLEYLAELEGGPDWRRRLLSNLEARSESGIRTLGPAATEAAPEA